MPKGPMPDQEREMLSRPNPAVMATVRKDGHPVSVATWYIVEDDGRILVNLDESRRRLEHLRRDGRVSLTALDGDDWYTHVSVQGRVVEVKRDDNLVDIDRLAKHYTGQPYRVRDRARYSVRVEVESWHGWGAMRQS